MNVSVSKNVLNVTIGETSLKLLTSAVVSVGGGDADTLNGEDGAYYLDRANHTGTQAISTIDGLQTALDSKIEGVAWGEITGTLSDQTDLQDAFDLKLDAADYNDRFLGLYASFFDLVAAYPTANAGDYAQVDLGIGSDVIIYAWDVSDNQWAAVGSSVIANTDALPEGSSNLYFTSQRVRDTTITGFTATNSAIISTDNIVQAFGKAQGQIDGLAEVAKSGSYLDLLNRPNIDESKSLVAFSASNKAITSNAAASVYSSNKTAFAADVSLDTTLYATYVCEIELLLDFPTAQPNGVGVMAFINGAIITFADEMQMAVNAVNNASIYKVRLEIARYSGGRLGVSGFGHGLNGAIVTYTHASAIYGSATFNVCVRFTGTPQTNNKIIVKSARLYKLNDPS